MRNSTVPPCTTKNKEDFSYCRGVDVLTSCQRCPVDSELSSASQDRLLSDEGFWGLGFGYSFLGYEAYVRPPIPKFLTVRKQPKHVQGLWDVLDNTAWSLPP